jgi:hypothetical protein
LYAADWCIEDCRANLADGVANAISEIPPKAMPMKQIACRLLLAMILLTMIAPLRFPIKEVVAQSSSQQKPIDDKTTNPAVESRKMTIAVGDEKGEPLPGTKITVMILETGGKRTMQQTLNYFTGDDGRVDVTLPQEFFYMRVWAYRSKYVPMAATFDHETDGINKGNKDIAAEVPLTFDFVLKPGIKLGGTVVDDTGEPIPGVKIRAYSRSVGLREEGSQPTTNPKPVPFDEYGAVLTNKEGHWVIDDVRERTSDIEFQLQLQHDDYISDTGIGGLQRDQGVTTEMLVTGNSKIVMKTGPRSVGTVVDSAGQPVTKGVVLWQENAYSFAPECEARLNNQGEFRSKVLKAGNYQVTVVAPGFMPESRAVQVVDRPEKADFALQPGKRIAIRIQDAEGNPLPKAVVRIENWRGFRALSINPAGLGIPSRPNDDGVYVWDWAPADAVTYRISLRNDPSYWFQVVSLAVQEAEHVVTLMPPLTFSGTVTDAITGHPLDEFVVIPVRVTQPKWLWTDYRQSKTSRMGKYEISNLSDPNDGRRYQIRVEAKGYRTTISEKSYDLTDGPVTLDFAMKPAAAATARVMNSAGKPVVGAFVIQATPTVMPMMPNGTIMESDNSQVLTTDTFGRFRIAASFEPARIRVIHPEGFAEVVRHGDEGIGTLTLRPWAKVSGTLLQNGVPAPNQLLQFNKLDQHETQELRFQEYYSARTDANGHFEFERLPPTIGVVTSPLEQDSPLMSLKPGENRTVTLGVGMSLTCKVVPIGRSDVDSSRYSTSCYLIRRSPGSMPRAEIPLLEFDLAKSVHPSCALDDSFEKWLATKDAHLMKLSPNGDFHASGVPAGEFDLLLEMFELPEGCVAETIGRRIVPIVVTDSDIAAGKKDAGRIEVECRVGPRVGQSMRTLQFIDADERERSIHDLRGQYVLLQVWTSSCSHCVNAMPEIQSARQRSLDKRIRFIGWNIDENPDSAKSLVFKNTWDWPQTYLGGNSVRVKQLSIRHVPAYYLIDREGLLVAAAEIWSTMAKKIDELK